MIKPRIPCVIGGLFLTVLQIFIAYSLSPGETAATKYMNLCRWDSYWYFKIIEHGYISTIPPTPQNWDVSNVAFFPGYPLIAWVIHKITGLYTMYAQLIAAQLAAWGFWTYFLLILRNWGVGSPLIGLGVLSVFAHPAAFFLVAGYAEPVFLGTLLGFFFWNGRGSRRFSKAMATTHGFYMTLTRVTGVVCAITPIIQELLSNRLTGLKSKAGLAHFLKGPVMITLISIAGAASFFIYCQWKWGYWDLYMQTQKIGWHVRPDYLSIFYPSNYLPFFPDLRSPNEISMLAVPFTALQFLILALAERLSFRFRAVSSRNEWKTRLPLYLYSLLMFYITISGSHHGHMMGYIRYHLPIHVPLVLAGVHLSKDFEIKSFFLNTLLIACITVLLCTSLAIQFRFTTLFTRYQWVA